MARHNSPAKPEQLQLFFSSRYLNIEQVADIMGVPKSFIYRRTARGHDDPIPHYRLGVISASSSTTSRSGSRDTETNRNASRRLL